MSAIDDFVIQIYEAGFLHSCIVHCLVLTFLALLFVRPEESAPPAIRLSFKNAEPEMPVVLEDFSAADFDATVAADQAPIEQPELSVVPAAPPAALPHVDPLDLAESVIPSQRPVVDDAILLEEVRVPHSATRRSRVVQVVAQGLAGESAAGDGAAGAMHGGIGGEMGRRLQAAGAQTGDVQVSIAWNNANDIDVHVMVEPLQFGQSSMISFMSPLGICGGMLDVDANAVPFRLTNRPVENIFWRRGMAPFGRFTIAVHHFQNWAGPLHTSVDVAVLVDGKVKTFKTLVTFGAPPRVVTSFVRQPPAAAPPVAVVEPSVLP